MNKPLSVCSLEPLLWQLIFFTLSPENQLQFSQLRKGQKHIRIKTQNAILGFRVSFVILIPII